YRQVKFPRAFNTCLSDLVDDALEQSPDAADFEARALRFYLASAESQQELSTDMRRKLETMANRKEADNREKRIANSANLFDKQKRIFFGEIFSDFLLGTLFAEETSADNVQGKRQEIGRLLSSTLFDGRIYGPVGDSS